MRRVSTFFEHHPRDETRSSRSSIPRLDAGWLPTASLRLRQNIMWFCLRQRQSVTLRSAASSNEHAIPGGDAVFTCNRSECSSSPSIMCPVYCWKLLYLGPTSAALSHTPPCVDCFRGQGNSGLALASFTKLYGVAG